MTTKNIIFLTFASLIIGLFFLINSLSFLGEKQKGDYLMEERIVRHQLTDSKNQRIKSSNNIDGNDTPDDFLTKQSDDDTFRSDASNVTMVNKYYEEIIKFAAEKNWNELTRVALILQSENHPLAQFIFLEAAKNNAPKSVYSSLSNMGIKLPADSSMFLISSSNIETLETLTTYFDLDLNYAHEVYGNSFSRAATENVGEDVFDFLITSGATLKEPGRFEPIQELMANAIIHDGEDAIRKIQKMLDYGAVLTNEHYEYAFKYRNYRPHLYSLVDANFVGPND